MSKLVIVIPAARHRCGRALLFGSDGATRFGPFRVLATSSGWAATRHGNDVRDWRKPFGHPPTGSYVVGGSLPPGVAPRQKRLRRFGALGALVLTPVAGDALEASRAGRKRFLIHGGPTDRRGRLRPTFGGFRVSDRELGALLRAVNEANAASDPMSSVEVVETTERPPWTDDGPGDRAGRLRPSFLPRRAGAMTLKHATLIALGFGIAGKGLRADASTGRRSFVGLALLTLGALGSAGCNSGADTAGSDLGGTSTDPSGAPFGGAGSGDPPDGGAGNDGGGAGGGYGGGGGDDLGGGGGDPTGGTTGDGAGAGDDTGGDSSGGAG